MRTLIIFVANLKALLHIDELLFLNAAQHNFRVSDVLNRIWNYFALTISSNLTLDQQQSKSHDVFRSFN